MTFEKTNVMNFSSAIKGMRNPLNSWNRSDSYFNIGTNKQNLQWLYEVAASYPKDDYKYRLEWLRINGYIRFNIPEESDEPIVSEVAFIGANDLDLMTRLVKSGNPHCKFLRQILVSVDITASIFW